MAFMNDHYFEMEEITLLKTKKIISTLMISALTIVAAIPASAYTKYESSYNLQPTSSNTSTLPGKDTWTKGLKNPGNGYYLAYSYYYNPSYIHGSKATLNGTRRFDRANAGQSSCANSDSERTTYGFVVSADVMTSGEYSY